MTNTKKIKTAAVRNPEVLSIAADEVTAGKARNQVEAIENIVLRSKRQTQIGDTAPATAREDGKTEQPQAQPA